MNHAHKDVVRHLRVIGRLYPDGRLRLRPSYLVESAPWSDREGDGTPELAVELLDAEDAVLAVAPLRVQSGCAFAQSGQARAVRGWIPFHPHTRSLRFIHRGRPVLRIRRPEGSPRVTLTWRPREREEGRRVVTWEAAHPQAEPMQFFLRYSHTGGRTWNRIGFRTEETRGEVDLDDLPGGERCLLAVVATDGINTSTAVSEPFSVALKPCRAMILAPVDGSTVRPGELVRLVGQGYWLEEGRTEREALIWTSSCAGELGRGTVVDLSTLTPGEHSITLLAGDEPRQGCETIVIHCAGGERRAERRAESA